MDFKEVFLLIWNYIEVVVDRGKDLCLVGYIDKSVNFVIVVKIGKEVKDDEIV